jgi:hypothetical protein
VSDHGTIVHSRTVIMAKGVGVPSGHGVDVMGTCGVLMLHFWEMGKPKLTPPPPLEVIANSLVESSRMVSSDGYL